MTRNQIILFGKKWTAAQQILLSREPGMDKDGLESERQDLLRLAGAKPDGNGRRSIKTLTNAQFSTFLDLLETTISGKKNQRRRSRSLIWKIEQTGLDNPYLDRIASDQFRVKAWRDLPVDNLLKLLMTAKSRAAARS